MEFQTTPKSDIFTILSIYESPQYPIKVCFYEIVFFLIIPYIHEYVHIFLLDLLYGLLLYFFLLFFKFFFIFQSAKRYIGKCNEKPLTKKYQVII